MKRKRNSNYIQKCIKLGNEYYNQERIQSLNWYKKNKDSIHENIDEQMKIDDKNMQYIKKK